MRFSCLYAAGGGMVGQWGGRVAALASPLLSFLGVQLHSGLLHCCGGLGLGLL